MFVEPNLGKLSKNDIAFLRKSLANQENTNLGNEKHSGLVDEFIKKFKLLNKEKQEYLLKVLDELKESENPEIIPEQVFTFRLKSTHGHSIIGLTEIEFYTKNRKVIIGEEMVCLKGGMIGAENNIMRLFNGKTKVIFHFRKFIYSFVDNPGMPHVANSIPNIDIFGNYCYY